MSIGSERENEREWEKLLGEVAEALGGATRERVAIAESRPPSEGWAARHGQSPCVRRCTLARPLADGAGAGAGAASVIVKRRRATADEREGAALEREHAALTLLVERGCRVGPAVLARGQD